MAETFGLTDPMMGNTEKRRQIQIQSNTQKAVPQKSKSPITQFEEEGRQDRRWKKILSKISFAPEPSELYNNYIVKPGFWFYTALATGDKFPIEQVQVNLPQTFICYDNQNYFIYTDNKGRLQRKQEHKANWIEFENAVTQENREFIKSLSQQMRDRFQVQDKDFKAFAQTRNFSEKYTIEQLLSKIGPDQNQDLPTLITRKPAGDQVQCCDKFILSQKQQREKKQGSQDNNSLDQRFIISRPLKATIVRFVYFTKNSNVKTASYGYRIQNYREIFENSKKVLKVKAALCTEEPNSFDIQLISSTGVKEYERQAESVVNWLEKNFNVRISETVFDFIQDLEGKVWLVNLKSLRAEKSITMEEIMQTKSKNEEGGKKNLDALICSVYCKLCGIIFKKDDASKVLTYKLLWELVQHLKKRGLQLKNIKVSHSSTRPCRVCNLCYMLVVGEHELIEVEQKFALAQNIPIQDPVIRVPIDSQPKHRPALLSENLSQWRLIFFIREISDIGRNQIIDMSKLHFQYRMNNSKTCFKIVPPEFIVKTEEEQSQLKAGFAKSSERRHTNDQDHESPEQDAENSQHHQPQGVHIQHIRVHYFFSELNNNIDNFLQNTQIKIRLTEGPEWNKFIAEGSSKTISHFKNKYEGGQRHTSQVLLFFENSEYCLLKLSAGLVCDGKYNTGKMNLHKFNDIYVPDEGFYNSNYFPDEWMEMFDQSYVSRKEEIKDKEGTIERYSPKCTKGELNKMIDFNSYKSKTMYREVESKIGQLIRVQSAQGQITKQYNDFQGTINQLQSEGTLQPEQQQKIQSSSRASTAKIHQKSSALKIPRPLTSVNLKRDQFSANNRKQRQGVVDFLGDKKNDQFSDILNQYQNSSQENFDDMEDQNIEDQKRLIDQQLKGYQQQTLPVNKGPQSAHLLKVDPPKKFNLSESQQQELEENEIDTLQIVEPGKYKQYLNDRIQNLKK